MREEVGKTMYHSLEGWQVSGDQFKWLFNSSHLGFPPELTLDQRCKHWEGTLPSKM